MPKLSNFVQLLSYPGGQRWGWRFRVSERPDKRENLTREEALAAAASAVKARYGFADVEIDSPAVSDMRAGSVKGPVRGEKRRRAGGHGYSGGDGFVRMG